MRKKLLTLLLLQTALCGVVFGQCLGTGNYTDSGQNLGSFNSLDEVLADLDGDGDMDAFLANSSNQANKVWLNDGSGNFTDSGQNLGSSNSWGVALEDLDGDGDMDAFVANYSNQANKVWFNDGSGNFTDSGQNLGSSNSLDVALEDLDGDGDMDAFVVNWNEANKVWLNDGSGNFTDSGQNLGSSDSEGIALGDMDGDGDMDAFVANYSNQANKVWMNDGFGNFTDSGQNLGSSNSEDAALADLDGDGDMDAFVGNYTSQANKVWLNDGSGNFTDSGQNLGGASSSGVALADLDGDGDMDAFVGNDPGANKVWLNDGAGNFTDSGQNLGSSNSWGVALGDLDGDGDMDAFVANGGWSGSQANKVWINLDPIITLSMSAGTATCSGNCDGTATVNASGNYPPFTYLWNDLSAQTNATAAGLCAGNYMVTVTDAYACTLVVDSVTVSDSVPTITTSMDSTDTQCSYCVGTATVTASGTYPPFSYLWNDGQTNSTATGLCAGSHVVIVTDANACTTAVDSTAINETVVFPVQEICLITVDSTSTKNLLVWEKPVTTGIDSFRIYREITTNNYQQIGNVAYNDISEFFDISSGVDPNITSYRYKVSVLDSCGMESALSDFHKTIHLIVSKDINNNPVLQWGDYEGFLVTSYRILIDSTGTNNWGVLGTVPFGNISYSDPNPPQTPFVRYLVEVVPPDTCTSNKMGTDYNTTRSNTTSVTLTGINKPGASSNNLLIYPNPFTNAATVVFDNAEQAVFKLLLYDVLGEQVRVMENITTNEVLIVKGHLTPGVYFISLQGNGKALRGKLMVE